ncbi:MAG: glucosaminidase domain-containing protein [Candidatus Pelagibacter bacterium]|nr:glucosaminidase domain-containing protein [Candidatus Pelagibacter bacterium]MBL6861026.1 glucosaminidase domain-containing protein [Candidatus Pelagibacter bacterium]
MKKKLSYRDKLIELAYIYDVKEIREYQNSRKNLTIGQLELILKKNKIVIPKDFKSNFLRDNIFKPVTKIKFNLIEFKENRLRDKNKFIRKAENFKHDSNRKIARTFRDIWKQVGQVGLNFLNIIPKLGKVIYEFFGKLFIDLFHGIYNQRIEPQNAKRVIIGIASVAVVSTIVFSGMNYFTSDKIVKKTEIKKEVIIKKPEIKKEVKKPDIQKENNNKIKNPEIKKKKEPKFEVKRKSVDEVTLPDLNLKTETVLNLFKDVEYDLGYVRSKKLVKPIYFTQFPKDLDALQSTQLKKETFIKIVLPLVVAENERILADREKLIILSDKKFTTDPEKQWIRQKLLEYKVKKGDLKELINRMDIIPTSLALAQAAKESGWGTSRFALEGNAIFGQWTWSGQGIAPLDRASNKSHKILKFPILRASVKAYKNNLNTHNSYSKFREKRSNLREKNKRITGLELTETLNNYAQTGSEYTKILNQIIRQNRLSDFEPVSLINSVKKIELSS